MARKKKAVPLPVLPMNRELPIYCQCGEGAELQGIRRDANDKLGYYWHCPTCDKPVSVILIGSEKG